MNVLKKIVARVRALIATDESLSASKQKWNRFGSENPLYYVYTGHGEKISDETFRMEGEHDYEALIVKDDFISARVPQKGKVLEIGCGAGRITEFFARNFSEVWGVDISDSMIGAAGKRLSHFTNVHLNATDGVHVPAPDAYFDLVFSFIVFQHMPSIGVIRENFAEIARVLTPGGIAKIQLRGRPTPRSSQFYGPYFDRASAEKLIDGLPLRIVKTEGEGEKYFWLWFERV